MRTFIAALAAVLAIGLTILAAPSFRAGAAQKASIVDMVANAKTAADHQAVAAYYDGQARFYKAQAELHRTLAERYQSLHVKPADMVEHCREMAGYFERLVKDAQALAAGHRKMAEAAEKK